MQEVFGSFAGLPAMLVLAAITATIARQHQRASAREQRRVVAAEALLEALIPVERCLRRWRFQPTASDAINAAMSDWDAAWRTHSGVLAGDWAHVNQGVRFAMGNAMGGAAAMAADLDVDKEWRGDPYHGHWWDVGLTYLEHLRAHLHHPSSSRRRARGWCAPVPYHEWRKDEDPDQRLRATLASI